MEITTQFINDFLDNTISLDRSYTNADILALAFMESNYNVFFRVNNNISLLSSNERIACILLMAENTNVDQILIDSVNLNQILIAFACKQLISLSSNPFLSVHYFTTDFSNLIEIVGDVSCSITDVVSSENHNLYHVFNIHGSQYITGIQVHVDSDGYYLKYRSDKIYIGRSYCWEMNIKKSKTLVISKCKISDIHGLVFHKWAFAHDNKFIDVGDYDHEKIKKLYEYNPSLLYRLVKKFNV